jgi:hypothetical protein
MALFPWRLQAEIPKGAVDPVVTVFMGGERAVLDADGNPTAATFIEQNTREPVQMPLSEAVAALENPELWEQARIKARPLPATE